MNNTQVKFSLEKESSWAQNLTLQLLDVAKSLGIEDVDCTAGTGSSLSVSVLDGESEDLSRSAYRSAGVRVISEGRLGFATSAQAPSSREECEELVRNALAMTAYASPSEYNVIPDTNVADINAVESINTRLNLFDPELLELDTEWYLHKALELEKVIQSREGISAVRGCGGGGGTGVFALASSNGFSGVTYSTSLSLHGTGIVNDADGKKQRGSWYDVKRHLNAIETVESIGQQAADRALAKVGARKVASGNFPVLFDPQMAKGFIGSMVGALDGESKAQGATFLGKSEGESVFAKGYEICDDPFVEKGSGSTPFDGEGLKVERRVLFDREGHIQHWLTDGRSAKRLGVQPGGNADRGASSMPGAGITNITLSGGRGSLEDFIKETSRGLLVTSMMGSSPDGITGEYSRGASGFWIEDGEIAFPVEGVTVAGQMIEMATSLDRVGDDYDTRSAIIAPSLRFEEMSVSGE